MHLAALILDRINWERLAIISVPLPSPHYISALCWSPDALHLVVASSDTTLTIYSVERASYHLPKSNPPTSDSSSKIASVKLPSSAAAIQWSTVNKFSLYRDRAGELEPKEEEKVEGILFVGDHQGAVTAFMYQLEFLVIMKNVLPEGHSVKALHIVKDKSTCIVVSTKQGKQPEEEDCVLGCIDSAHLTEFTSEITALGVQVVALRSFLPKLNAVHDLMSKEWIDGATKLLANEIMVPLQKAMDAWESTERFGYVPGNPWVTLDHMFCGACVSEGTLQFLDGTSGNMIFNVERKNAQMT